LIQLVTWVDRSYTRHLAKYVCLIILMPRRFQQFIIIKLSTIHFSTSLLNMKALTASQTTWAGVSTVYARGQRGKYRDRKYVHYSDIAQSCHCTVALRLMWSLCQIRCIIYAFSWISLDLPDVVGRHIHAVYDTFLLLNRLQ